MAVGLRRWHTAAMVDMAAAMAPPARLADTVVTARTDLWRRLWIWDGNWRSFDVSDGVRSANGTTQSGTNGNGSVLGKRETILVLPQLTYGQHAGLADCSESAR